MSRRKGREAVLSILYQWDITKEDIEKILKEFWRENPYSPDIVKFASVIVTNTVAHIESIDSLLSKYSNNWTLKRMNTVDRNILRSATVELMFMDDIPSKVIINEAIEIAKKFSSKDSHQFINGILDKIKDEVRKVDPSERETSYST